ncbi:mannose-1-phosphate guanylyltransferase [Paenibacillus sp. 481]|uniref:mannose-1-phosphate guanylyltransferase n=1 Tax=Paenibacillus sp. 481 TaxID=2835869 RepID=UPI001E6366FE|nr:sugar phosphate nucleotidyltransferase [Paenibacillus sp. 481]UHA72289.1 mannose-1-phosphate guanylyltransferase [Paenibacillus sp. 481]
MIVVIMAGGKGTRFWPSSTASKPKQFLPLLSGYTMLQETYMRFRQWLPIEQVYVATTSFYKDLVLEQLPELDEEQIIVEPMPRDTGPCTALTALFFLRKGIDDCLVMAPSDQYMADIDGLRMALLEAEAEAVNNRATIMLGILPTRPETGYGYIRTEPWRDAERMRKVVSFLEKPNRSVADELLRSPGTYWNSGIFVWRPSTIAHLMETYCPAIWLPLFSNYPHVQDIYHTLPKLSVDFAIIEKSPARYVIPVDFDWDDIGTWNAVSRFYNADGNDNLLNGKVQSLSSNGNIVFSDKHAVIIGVSDLIIVSTEDGLLVCHRSQEQRIKEMLNENITLAKPQSFREVKPFK